MKKAVFACSLGGFFAGSIAVATTSEDLFVPFPGMLLPALAKAKTKAHGIACLNHLKQLQLAWFMYAGDHNDKLAPNLGLAFLQTTDNTWVRGILSFDVREASYTDNTN